MNTSNTINIKVKSLLETLSALAVITGVKKPCPRGMIKLVTLRSNETNEFGKGEYFVKRIGN